MPYLPKHCLNLSLLLCCQLSFAATFRVGSNADASCTHTTLPAAVAAAAANADATNTILLANNTTYTGVRVLLNNGKRLNVEGGFDNCLDATSDPAQPTVLNALAGDSMFEVRLTGGIGVFLTSVIIQGGGDTDAGGGIEVRSGNVSLDNVQVRNNRARYGGGVYVDGLGAAVPARVQIGVNTRPSFIYNNEAFATNGADGLGGGVHAGNGGTIAFVSGGITDNRARQGGGISVDTGARLQFVGVQPPSPPVIRNNSVTGASAGGGIAAASGADVSTNNATRIFIDGNFGLIGAAIYATGGSTIDLRYAWIKGNRRPVGSTNTATAIFADTAGTEVILRGGPLHVRCENGEFCSQLQGSIEPSSAISANAGTRVELERIHVSAFQSSFSIMSGSNSTIVLSNSLVSGNQAASLFGMIVGANVRLNYSTVTNNIVSAVFVNTVTATTGNVQLHGSVVHGNGPLAAPGNELNFSNGGCVSIVNENANADGVGIVFANAGLDANFLPTASGAATDRCETDTAFNPDIEDNARPVDLPVGNVFGPQDLGAYERQATVVDPIFRNGFE
jgi:hypothetical protein